MIWHGRSPSAAVSSLRTFWAIWLCSSSAPAMATIWPPVNSWRTSATASSARYSFAVKRVACVTAMTPCCHTFGSKRPAMRSGRPPRRDMARSSVRPPWRPSEREDRGAPGEAGAEDRGQDAVAALDAAVLPPVIDGERDAGGGGVAVELDRVEDLVARDAGDLGDL